jgi:acyl-CoA synthetase (AMP-forming)/AMP-acid ligase II
MVQDPSSTSVVALLAPSNVDYVVSLFALSRLGYAVLCLSLRIAPNGIVNLLDQAKCSTIVHGPASSIRKKVEEVSQERSIDTLAIPSRATYDLPPCSRTPPIPANSDTKQLNSRTALIMHSSGSTGLPKPVYLSHRAVLTHAILGPGLHNINPLPLYHLHGISTMVQAMYLKSKANMCSASMPLTADNLINAIETVRPEIIHAVPYTLGLLAEQRRGIAYLKAAQCVTSGGAHTPDELGDRLTREGVRLGISFGW